MPVRREVLSKRVIALLLGSSLAAGAWFFSVDSRGRDPAALVDNSFAEKAEWTSRQLLPRGSTPPSGVAAPSANFQRREFSVEELTRFLGKLGRGGRLYDPKRIIRYRGGLNERVDWPEYPGGHWTRVTNSEGVREDHEFPTPGPDVFVLVTGDSHTEGVCDDAASYSNLLERVLADRRPGKSVEVYNTGMNGYSFYNYLGALEAFVERQPQVFVTTFFAGNDFVEVLKLHHAHAGSAPPPRPLNYWNEITERTSIPGSALAQGLTQLLYLRENPDEAQLALQAALYATQEIQRICEAHGIRWLVVYLPSPFDLPLAEWKELREQAAEKLAISEADFEIANRLGDQLLAALKERGVQILDLRPIFRLQTKPLYWSDLHIDLDGQRLVADTLDPLVEELLAR